MSTKGGLMIREGGRHDVMGEGLVEALRRLVVRRAEVGHVARVGDLFRMVTLHGEDLVGARWAPGQSVRIELDRGLSGTYTPLVWDVARGTIDLLAYVGGAGPASVWLRTVRAGTTCSVARARGEADLGRVPFALFGDETTFATAAALRRAFGTAILGAYVFEVGKIGDAEEALDRLDLRDAVVLERTAGSRHLEEVRARLVRLSQKGFALRTILTGNAASIARVRTGLLQAGVATRSITTRVHWTPVATEPSAATQDT